MASITDLQHPIASRLNALPKYVASTTLTSVDWNNSTLLGSDTVAAIEKLKSQPGGELQVQGSGNLIQTLIEHDLVDEYRLLIYPVHLGAGKKLFHWLTATNREIVAMIGLLRGYTNRNKMVNSPPPSMRTDSRSSSGILVCI